MTQLSVIWSHCNLTENDKYEMVKSFERSNEISRSFNKANQSFVHNVIFT